MLNVELPNYLLICTIQYRVIQIMITATCSNIGFEVIATAKVEIVGVDEFGDDIYSAGTAILTPVTFAGEPIEPLLEALGWELEPTNSQSVISLATCIVSKTNPNFDKLVGREYKWDWCYVTFQQANGEELYYCHTLGGHSKDIKFPAGIYSESIANYLNSLY